MGNDYSEAQLIKQTCIDIFKNQLQLEIANVYQRETFSKNGTMGRASEAARNLLNRPKNTEFKVDRRIEKVQTASAVKKAIHNYLYYTLPHPTYGDGDRVVKTEILYNYFKTRYADYGRVAK